MTHIGIAPTVGRIVLVHLSGNKNTLAGLICAVHERGINVAGFDEHGVAYRASGVRLVQPDEEIPASFSGTWAEWMPYQKAVAAGEIAPLVHAVTIPPETGESGPASGTLAAAGNVGDVAAVQAGVDAVV